MNEKEIAKAALQLDWEYVESQARQVAEYAAEINPVELIGAEFAKCRAAEADPRAVDVLLEALNFTLKEHGFQVVPLADADPLRASVDAMVRMLEEGEWAEHVAATTGQGDPLAQRLEDRLTALMNEPVERSDAPALSREAISTVAAASMDSSRYYYFMALIDDAMRAAQDGKVPQ